MERMGNITMDGKGFEGMSHKREWERILKNGRDGEE